MTLVERLKDWCRDWDGNEMVDCTTTRSEVYCGDVREVITLIEAQDKALREAREALHFYATEWRKVDHGLGFAGPDLSPTHALCCDYGARGEQALATIDSVLGKE